MKVKMTMDQAKSVLRVAIPTACMLFMAFSLSFGQSAPIVIWGDTIEVFAGLQNVEFPLYLSNSQDNIVSATAWLTISNPNLVIFDQVEGEFSIDPVIIFEETLLDQKDWQITSRTISGFGQDLLFVSSANLPLPVDEIAPQGGVTPFFKASLNIEEATESLPDSIANIHLAVAEVGLEYINQQYVIDTSYAICNEWDGENCLDTAVVPNPPYDFLVIDSYYVADIVPGEFETFDGVVKVFLCGDVNLDLVVNIIDIVDLIEEEFFDGTNIKRIENADVNHDGLINILDIVVLIDFKLKGGPPPACY